MKAYSHHSKAISFKQLCCTTVTKTLNNLNCCILIFLNESFKILYRFYVCSTYCKQLTPRRLNSSARIQNSIPGITCTQYLHSDKHKKVLVEHLLSEIHTNSFKSISILPQHPVYSLRHLHTAIHQPTHSHTRNLCWKCLCLQKTTVNQVPFIIYPYNCVSIEIWQLNQC